MIDGFVRQSGGQVGLESAPGEGTVVTVYLPRHSGVAGKGEEKRVGTAAVLVVDDEAAVRMVVADALSSFGHTILEAADSRAASGIVESEARVDLLLTDSGLPGGMSG